MNASIDLRNAWWVEVLKFSINLVTIDTPKFGGTIAMYLAAMTEAQVTLIEIY